MHPIGTNRKKSVQWTGWGLQHTYVGDFHRSISTLVEQDAGLAVFGHDMKVLERQLFMFIVRVF